MRGYESPRERRNKHQANHEGKTYPNTAHLRSGHTVGTSLDGVGEELAPPRNEYGEAGDRGGEGGGCGEEYKRGRKRWIHRGLRGETAKSVAKG